MEDKEEAGQEMLEQLQSEVDELRGQLAELQQEKEALMKQTRSLEDRQVINWKWIQEATKFSGVSVNKCDAKSCTFHFHPMWKSVSLHTYSMTVSLTPEGYNVGRCFLPESINLPDLDNSKPLDILVSDISNLVDSFCHRQQQMREIEEEFGDIDGRSIMHTVDTLKASLRVRVSGDAGGSCIVAIHLRYQPDEILPSTVEVELEDEETLNDITVEDFENNCAPFYQLSLLEAYRDVFSAPPPKEQTSP